MEIATIAPLIAIVAGLFGILAKYRLDIWRDKRNERIQAAAKFRSVFSDVLIQIHNETIDPQSFLVELFVEHGIAVKEFAGYLGDFKGKRFLKAWQEYQCHDGVDFRLSVPYTTIGGSIEQKRENREKAIAVIHKLISYADQA